MYISEYFCNAPDRATELIDLKLSTRRITLDSKADVFRVILDKITPDKKKENSVIAKDLKFIVEERNMLAHYYLEVSG